MSRFVSIVLPLTAVLVLPTAVMRSDRAVDAGDRVQAEAWTETKWPFPMDQWGLGRAYRCTVCGAEMKLYLRAKAGFCNCETGVADDAEVDRVADVDLVSARYAPAADGKPVTVGWMRGRSRTYALDAPGGRAVLAIAFNDRCDVVVATVVGERELPARAEDAALAFLNGNRVLAWAKAELGL